MMVRMMVTAPGRIWDLCPSPDLGPVPLAFRIWNLCPFPDLGSTSDLGSALIFSLRLLLPLGQDRCGCR